MSDTIQIERRTISEEAKNCPEGLLQAHSYMDQLDYTILG